MAYAPMPIPVHHGDMDPETARVLAISFGAVGAVILAFYIANGIVWITQRWRNRR